MKLLILIALVLCTLSPPFAQAAQFPADRHAAFAANLSNAPSEEERTDSQLILAGAAREQCQDKCNARLKSCVASCPGFDENNVVDPKYAARKCKAACDADLTQCKTGCPGD